MEEKEIKMKAIMISIQPQWVDKILNGEKTIEIRKTMPKCELPCKVYIYCTNGYMLYDLRNEDYLELKKNYTLDVTRKSNKYLSGTPPMLNRKVVAEFTLNKIETLWQNNKNKTSTATVVDKAIFEKQTCMTWEQYCEYHKCKNGKYPNSYAWHIDDLKIYDKPKELSEFRKRNKCHYADYDEGCCFECCTFYDLGDCDGGYSELERPPQSWCYVEELENE